MIVASAGSAFKWLQIAARNALTCLADTVAAVSAVGWVFVALAVLALLWVWAGMHASTRLGPIEVTPLEHDGQRQAALHSLIAAFRERLSRCGLTPPPTVPEGAPQANLIKAVEGSAIPQGATIARLLELLPSPPRPAQYKFTGTLSGQEDPAESACGVSFWLQPMNGGTPYLQTVAAYPTHTEALTHAASDIYLHIAKATPDAFPLWVRWHTREGLEAYLEGCDLRKQGDFTQAVESLEQAIIDSPFNALAALQLANLEEQRAAVGSQTWTIAFLQTRALQRYLAVGRLWPTLVEARYRSSVTAAALATTYTALNQPQQQAIALLLALAPSTEGVTRRLRQLADRESSATLQLLKPWYTLARENRLRNQFESKGRERSSLRHTARISRHCVRVRRMNAETGGGSQFMVRYDDARVHIIHMLLGKANVTWQGRYNAACFDALQLAVDRMSDRRRSKVERRALRNVDTAIREAAGDLTHAWVNNDPDFAYFR